VVILWWSVKFFCGEFGGLQSTLAISPCCGCSWGGPQRQDALGAAARWGQWRYGGRFPILPIGSSLELFGAEGRMPIGLTHGFTVRLQELCQSFHGGLVSALSGELRLFDLLAEFDEQFGLG